MYSQVDHDLLQSFATKGSQAAFTELVQRHVSLVYSTARRLVSDAHLAEDITQQVFALLARKAGKLDRGTVLPAWLYRTACYLASEALRRERRRVRRELLAAQELNPSAADSRWEQIEPWLEEAMASLRGSDHDAIVLRYFENRSLKEVGAALGLTDDAAQKRVARALDRLRVVLGRRGITVSVTGLVTALSASAVQTAPAGLASAASSTSLALAAAGVIPQMTPYMIVTKLKTVVLAVIVAALSLTSVLVWRHGAVLRHQVADLRASTLETDRAGVANIRPGELGISSNELRRLRLAHLEVLSLRGKIAQLSNEMRRPRGGVAESNAVADSTATQADSILFTAAATNRVSNGSTLVVGGWSKEGMRGYLLATPLIPDGATASADGQVVVQSKVVGAPEAFWEQIGWGSSKSETRRSTLAGVLTPEQVDTLLTILKDTPGAEISNDSSATNRNGHPIGFGFSVDDEDSAGIIMGMDLYPRVTPDGQSVDLELRPSGVSPEAVHSSLRPGAESTSSLTQ